MGEAFFDPAHKIQKLDGTICTYKGVPHFVSAGLEGDKVLLSNLLNPQSKQFEVKYTDDDFDYRSPSLGYLNYGPEAYYLARNPLRQNQQAISRRTVIIVGKADIHVDAFFATKAMAGCILGDHPTLDRALEEVTSGKSKSRAFHRHCALEDNGRYINLRYRGRRVGYKEKDAFRLLPSGDYSFMQAILRKMGVPLC